MASIDQLNEQFGLGEVARFESGGGGLPRLAVTARAAAGHVYLHGAHVTRYQPAGQDEVLFLSRKSHFETGKAVRGGVPVIFPWFGPRDGNTAAMHGFVRTRPWRVVDVREAGDAVVASFEFGSDEQTRSIWPHDFGLRFDVSFGHSLDMALHVSNRSAAAFEFEEALHTYFSVGDIRSATLEGLGSTRYVDKVLGVESTVQEEASLKFSGPIDRVYLDTRAACVITDPIRRRRVTIAKENSSATVVWNPWSDRVGTMTDLDAREWPNFLCVETCNVRGNRVSLAPGGEHVMRCSIESQAM